MTLRVSPQNFDYFFDSAHKLFMHNKRIIDRHNKRKMIQLNQRIIETHDKREEPPWRPLRKNWLMH